MSFKTIELTVNGVDVSIIDENTYKTLNKNQTSYFHKIPKTSFYLYEHRLTKELFLKLSGLEKLGEVDSEFNTNAVDAEDTEFFRKVKSEGWLPVTFYPKNRNENVRFVWWSEIRKMAFENIRKVMSAENLKGYNVKKCCLKNKKTAKRSNFPKLNVEGMF